MLWDFKENANKEKSFFNTLLRRRMTVCYFIFANEKNGWPS